MNQFKTKAINDKRLTVFRKRIEHGVYVIDTKQLLDELFNLHETRFFRSYDTKEVMGSVQKKLLRANIQNSAYRSRAAAIKMRCFTISQLLKEDVENATNYLSTKYMLALKSDFTTKEDRAKAVKDLLREPITLFNKIKTVIEMADILVADLDAEGWAITRAINIFNLSTTKERNI